MIQAIVDRADWKNSNTEVIQAGDQANIYLHDNLIGVYHNKSMALSISHAGWETNTTKSRLNALAEFVTGNHPVFQKNHQWFITSNQGTKPMAEGWHTV